MKPAKASSNPKADPNAEKTRGPETNAAERILLDDVYTTKDLLRLLSSSRVPGGGSSNFVVERPKDLASVFFMSYMAYHRRLLCSIRIDAFNVLGFQPKRRQTPFVLFADLPDRFVLSIRGTQKLADIAGALLMVAERLDVPANLRAAFQHKTDVLERLAETMHRGVLNHALEALSLVLDKLSLPGSGKKRVVCYGHSLGAACAVVIAHLLRKLGFEDVACYCLACPQVFQPACPVLKERLLTDYVHYFTREDPVVVDAQALLQLATLKKHRLYAHGDATRNVALPLPPEKRRGLLDAHHVFWGSSEALGRDAATGNVKNEARAPVPRKVVLVDKQWANVDFGCP